MAFKEALDRFQNIRSRQHGLRAAGQILERDAALGYFIRAQDQHSLHAHPVGELELPGQLGCFGVASNVDSGYAQLRGQLKRLGLQLG